VTEPTAPLVELTEAERELAWSRWLVLAPTVEDGVPLTRSASHAGVPVSTARRWLARYRSAGLAGLARCSRSDRGHRRTHPELVQIIEALALRKPRPSTAAIPRRVQRIARERGWREPAERTVASIVGAIDPGLMMLAHDGPSAFRDRFELAYRLCERRRVAASCQPSALQGGSTLKATAAGHLPGSRGKCATHDLRQRGGLVFRALPNRARPRAR
jgi:putative transposase